MELPKEFKGTIYFYQNVKHDYLTCRNFEINDNPEYVLLGTLEADVSFDVDREAATKQLVSNLQAEKKRIQADTQKQLNQIDEQINSLLAITHQS